jgi:RNA polymerase sigma-70 factor (ECF subfamily)
MYRQATQTSQSIDKVPGIPVRAKPPVMDPREEIVAHLRPMRAFAMSLTRDRARADDVVQETVLKAWSNIEKFEPGTNMRAWLFTILRNTFYSERRKAAREVADHDGTMSERMSVRPDHDGNLALADFRRAFQTLPDVQREALILVGAEGFSYEEAADMCGCAIGTIKSRANRGRRRLVVLLEMEEGEQVGITDHTVMGVIERRAVRNTMS